jgi:hypothetical protein
MSDRGDGRSRRGPFGPLEALDEAQRQAFEAAMRIAGELTALGGDLPGASWFGRAGGADGHGPGSTPGSSRPLDVGRLRSDVVRAAETFSELLRALLDAGFDAMDEVARRPAARPAASVAPGATARLHCTVHNGDREPARGVRPHVRQLVSDGGDLLAATVTIRPESLDLEPYERVDLVVEVAVPAGAAPGRYHGLLLVAGLPDVASALAVDVADGTEAGDDG